MRDPRVDPAVDDVLQLGGLRYRITGSGPGRADRITWLVLGMENGGGGASLDHFRRMMVGAAVIVLREEVRGLEVAVVDPPGVLPGMPHFGTYRIIVADPPWEHDNYGQAAHGAAKAKYDEMPIEAMEAMPVGALAHPDGALLALWCTGPQAADGLHIRLATAWGFRLVTRGFAWVKTNADGSIYFGTGNYTGGNVEDVWIGVRGDARWPSTRARRDVRSVVMATRGEHSAKPEAVQDRLEALWPDATPRLELFARRRRQGWACWGSEAPACDLVFGREVGTTWPVPRPAEVVEQDQPDEQRALFTI